MAASAPAVPGRRRPRPRPFRVLLALSLVLALLVLAVVSALALRIRSELLAVPATTAPDPRAVAHAEPGGAPGGVPSADSAADPFAGAEAVTFPTGRGELPGLFVEGRSRTWAVLLHGAGAQPSQTHVLAAGTVAAGLPTLAISYRNDAGVPPDPSGRYGYGRTEWRDLEAAVAHARDQGAERVVLGGVGMGGSIVAGYLERGEREPGEVRAVLLDAPVLDLAAVVDADLASLDLPLGLQVPAAAAGMARQVSARLDDVDWQAVDYLDDTDWLAVPALVLHAADDQETPVATSRRLAALEPDLVRLVELDGRGGDSGDSVAGGDVGDGGAGGTTPAASSEVERFVRALG